MSFDMTPAQQKAFSVATGGVNAKQFADFFLIVIGIFATVWLLLYVVGLFKALQEHKIDFGELGRDLAYAGTLYIITGILIYFT